MLFSPLSQRAQEEVTAYMVWGWSSGYFPQPEPGILLSEKTDSLLQCPWGIWLGKTSPTRYLGGSFHDFIDVF